MDKRSELGKAGEEIVAKKLEQNGFSILHKNYAQRYGEIDLIASKDDLILFIEVKMRQKSGYDLENLITPAKQKKIILVAKQYMAKYDVYDKVCRFDVALIQGTEDNYNLKYIPNAFYEPESY